MIDLTQQKFIKWMQHTWFDDKKLKGVCTTAKAKELSCHWTWNERPELGHSNWAWSRSVTGKGHKRTDAFYSPSWNYSKVENQALASFPAGPWERWVMMKSIEIYSVWPHWDKEHVKGCRNPTSRDKSSRFKWRKKSGRGMHGLAVLVKVRSCSGLVPYSGQKWFSYRLSGPNSL